MSQEYFRHCSTCKKNISYGAQYYKCSVSTCNRKGTALFFCSVSCWDAHVPDARHRDAWAEVEKAPERPEAPALLSEEKVRRKVVASPTTGSVLSESSPSLSQAAVLPQDTLVVMSKLKAYIRAHSEMKTSETVLEVLSEHLRNLCRQAARSAQTNERKTILARDFSAILRGEKADE